MDEYYRRPGNAVSDEQKLTYAGMYMLKKLDLDPKEGGMHVPLLMPPELTPLDEVMHALLFDELVEIDRRKERYQLSKKGIDHIGRLIDEAEALIDEFDDDEMEDVVAELRRRNQDVFRARFLWGWYEGEFDDLVLFQQRRGITPVERLWAYYLLDDAFYNELAKDIAGADQ